MRVYGGALDGDEPDDGGIREGVPRAGGEYVLQPPAIVVEGGLSSCSAGVVFEGCHALFGLFDRTGRQR